MSRPFKKINTTNIPLAIAIGLMTGLSVTGAGMVICTTFINKSVLSENSMTFICPIVWFLSAFTGSIASCTLAKSQFLLTCGITGLTYFGVLFLISIMFLDGAYGQVGWGILSVVLGMIPAVLLFVRKEKPAKAKYRFR